MSYRRTLLFGWSREDRLGVLVISVTVAFLVGTTLFVFAAGSQTAALAADLESPGGATFHGSPEAAEAAADADAIVLPLAPVTGPGGEPTYAVGVPSGTDRRFGTRGLTASPPTRGDLQGSATHRLEGGSAVTIEVAPRRDSILPPSWYAVRPATVEALGSSGALVVEPDAGLRAEAPLRGVLGFFRTGTEQLLGVVSLIAVAGGVLVAITAYSITRMTVADRREDLRVIRATGATPTTVLRLFGLRAGLLGGIGVALGYAIGVITANAAVNLAVAIGLPTSLTVEVSRDLAAFLGAVLATMVAVAVLGGLLAARRAAVVPPASIAGRGGTGNGWLSLRVLDGRALVPTAATLTAFLLVSSVFVAGGAVVAPLTATDQATITEPGSTHPISSQVPAGYVDGLEAAGIDASGEILLFGVRNGEPVPMRGVDYDAFASMSAATIVEGRSPRAADEAVVGSKLGDDVEVGDTITVGGSTRSAVTRVRVVGRFHAPGADGAMLLVSRETARHLTGLPAGAVNVIRATRLPATSNEGVVVTDVTVLDDPVAGRPLQVEVSLSNTNPARTNQTVTVRYADQRQDLAVDLAAGATTRRTLGFDALEAGTYDLTAGEHRSTIRVRRPDQLSFDAVPPVAPPGSTPRVRVVDATGSPAGNVTVRVGDTSRSTAEDGTVRVPLNDTGSRALVAGAGETAARTTIPVRAGAPTGPITAFSVRPETPDVLVRPTATLAVTNPWRTARTATVTIRGPAGRTTRHLDVAPGERRTVTRHLDRRPPGTYNVSATVDGATVAERSYRVTGDERIPAAVATSGREGTSPLGEAIQVAFGDLQLVAVALVGLAAMMTVGATTATFAAAIRARRRDLGVYRASGAPPRRILRLVVGDALRVGVVATVLAAVVAGVGLLAFDRAGVLTVFGVRLLPVVDPLVALAVAVAALAVVVVSAAIATMSVLRLPPAELVHDRADTGGVADD